MKNHGVLAHSLIAALVLSTTMVALPATASTAQTIPLAVEYSRARVPTQQIGASGPWVKKYVKWILEDIKELDIRVQDGIQVASRLIMLGDNFDRLLEEGAIPRNRRANYLARVQTLRDFAYRAADEYDYGDESAGYARYMVIRKETGPLLSAVNRAYGTRFRLP